MLDHFSFKNISKISVTLIRVPIGCEAQEQKYWTSHNGQLQEWQSSRSLPELAQLDSVRLGGRKEKVSLREVSLGKFCLAEAVALGRRRWRDMGNCCAWLFGSGSSDEEHIPLLRRPALNSAADRPSNTFGEASLEAPSESVRIESILRRVEGELLDVGGALWDASPGPAGMEDLGEAKLNDGTTSLRKLPNTVANGEGDDMAHNLGRPLPLSRTDITHHEQVALAIGQTLTSPLKEQDGETVISSFGSSRQR